MSLIHTICITASVNLVAINFSVRGNLGLFPCFHFICLLHLSWTLEVVMSIAKPGCLSWIPLLSAPATFLSHEATDYCMWNLMSQSNSWRGDSCHAPMARCVHMAASVTKWDAASCDCGFYDVLCLPGAWLRANFFCHIPETLGKSF